MIFIQRLSHHFQNKHWRVQTNNSLSVTSAPSVTPLHQSHPSISHTPPPVIPSISHTPPSVTPLHQSHPSISHTPPPVTPPPSVTPLHQIHPPSVTPPPSVTSPPSVTPLHQSYPPSVTPLLQSHLSFSHTPPSVTPLLQSHPLHQSHTLHQSHPSISHTPPSVTPTSSFSFLISNSHNRLFLKSGCFEAGAQ